MSGPERRLEPHAHQLTYHSYQAPAAYVTMPTRLLDDLRDSPVAVGVYSLIARLYLIYRGPIPLSTPDLQRYDPRCSRGAAIRALQRLQRGGWLVEAREAGHKTSYTPAWGLIAGQARAWTQTAAGLGRPRHVNTLRLDRRLLDTCLGKLTPHPSHAAQIERYLTEPMLSLADVGAYALALAGHPTTSPLLARYGLLSAAGLRPLPTDQELLALASQRALLDDHGPELALRGLEKLGCRIVPTAPSADRGQPVFFVSCDLIGSMIGSLIEPAPDQAAGNKPLQRDPGRQASHSLGSTATLSDLKGAQGSSPLPPEQLAGGSGAPGVTRRDIVPGPVGQSPTTISADLLRSLNVRPEVVRELAGVDPALIQAAIADGQAREDVRDLAGWVVALVRAAGIGGWRIPTGAGAGETGGERAMQARIARMKATGLFRSDDDLPPSCGLSSDHQGAPLAVQPDLRSIVAPTRSYVDLCVSHDEGSTHIEHGRSGIANPASGVPGVAACPEPPAQAGAAGGNEAWRPVGDPVASAMGGQAAGVAGLAPEGCGAYGAGAELLSRSSAAQEAVATSLSSARRADECFCAARPLPTTERLPAPVSAAAPSDYPAAQKDDRSAEAPLPMPGMAELAPAGAGGHEGGLAGQLRAELRLRLRPALWPVLAGLSLCERPGELVLRCSERAHIPLVQHQLLPLVRSLVAALGLMPAPRVTLLL